MKYKLLLLNFLFFCSFSLGIAQTGDYFTGLDGIQAARERMQALNLGSSKLIAIYTSYYVWNGNSGNAFIKGKSQNWCYTFSCDKDKKIVLIFLEKQNNNYIQMGIQYYGTDTLNTSNFFMPFLTAFNDIPEGLLDSDAEFVFQNEKRQITSNINKVEMLLSYSSNVIMSLDNPFKGFVWRADVEDTISYWHLPVQSEWAVYLFSAETGEFIDGRIYTGIENTPIKPGLIRTNVACDFLYLSTNNCTDNQVISVYSTHGELVLETAACEKIDVGGLVPGLYFVRCGNQSGKFIKI